MYFELDTLHTDPKRIRKEREKARALRMSDWWKQKLALGNCHYCGEKFAAKELTMDHVVPLSRGGLSTRGNLVPSCKPCNQSKGLATPVDLLLS